MRKFALFALLLTLAFAYARPPSIGTLYQRELSGTLRMTCTASIVEGEQVGVDAPLALLTAAHCVNRDLMKDDDTGRTMTRAEFLVTFDEQEFYTVRLSRVGRTDRGYDAAVLYFSSRAPEIAPLHLGSWDTVTVGDRIRNYANPMGIGMQAFEGYISMMRLERPVEGTNIYWRDNAVAIVPGAGGSSGSLILNADGEVVGILVGVIQASMGTPFVVFVPVWKVEQMLTNPVTRMDISY
jgi:hypothetical protein